MTRAAAVASVVALLLVLVLVGSGCGGRATARSLQAHHAGRLSDLRSVKQLTSLFNASVGEPRLVVLMSPT